MKSFPSQWSKAIGNALFVVVGGLLKRRAMWEFANDLRLPVRPLPTECFVELIRIFANVLIIQCRQATESPEKGV